MEDLKHEGHVAHWRYVDATLRAEGPTLVLTFRCGACGHDRLVMQTLPCIHDGCRHQAVTQRIRDGKMEPVCTWHEIEDVERVRDVGAWMDAVAEQACEQLGVATPPERVALDVDARPAWRMLAKRLREQGVDA